MSKSAVNFSVYTGAILEDTTNEKFLHYRGFKGRLFVKEGFSATFDMLRGYLYTSVVKKATTEGNKLILTTLNSVYTFRIKDSKDEK